MFLLLEQIVVEVIEVLRCAAVHIVPPVAGEVLLLEHRPVGADEAVLDQTEVAGAAGQADVEHLAVGLQVGVISTAHAVLAAEVGVGDRGIDRVIHPGLAGNLLQKLLKS